MAPLAPIRNDTTSRCIEEQEKTRKKQQQQNVWVQTNWCWFRGRNLAVDVCDATVGVQC